MYQGSKQDQRSPSKQEFRIETLHFDCMDSRGSGSYDWEGYATGQKYVGHWKIYCKRPFPFATITVDGVDIIMLVESVVPVIHTIPSR
jgi:hypothetical protein